MEKIQIKQSMNYKQENKLNNKKNNKNNINKWVRKLGI